MTHIENEMFRNWSVCNVMLDGIFDRMAGDHPVTCIACLGTQPWTVEDWRYIKNPCAEIALPYSNHLLPDFTV